MTEEKDSLYDGKVEARNIEKTKAAGVEGKTFDIMEYEEGKWILRAHYWALGDVPDEKLLSYYFCCAVAGLPWGEG